MSDVRLKIRKKIINIVQFNYVHYVGILQQLRTAQDRVTFSDISANKALHLELRPIVGIVNDDRKTLKQQQR